ncbi:hypothetical protein [Actinomadura sp. 21ATH]|uniref:hypothetical protein n=1 Tax=Actinomadura sp. 21ATH TaxID=1735444 RepID=UPI0035C1DA47
MAPRQAAPIPVGVQPVGSFFSLDVDIRGLAALANKLYGYVSPGEAIIDEVEETIKRLVRHAGWRGSDANEFQDAWTVDAGDARKLSMFIDDVAKMMDDLASALAELQIAANNRQLDYEQKSSLSPNHPERIRDLSLILRDAQGKSRMMQAEVAQRLVALYSGKAQESWSVLSAVKDRSKGGDISRDLREKLEAVDDELDDALSDDDFPWTDFVSWAGGVAGIGGVLGSFAGGVGAVPGSALGGGIGLAVGAVVGGGRWTIDQIDDWF